MTTPRQRKSPATLRSVAPEFWRHPSPWMIAATLGAAAAGRVRAKDWRWRDAGVPVVAVALFPLVEWIIHTTTLHFKPRKIGRVTLDFQLARDHRAHHVDPRNVPLVFIPWQTLCGVIAALFAIALAAFRRRALGLTFLTTVGALGLVYEWTHYLIHTDYKPKGRLYRSIWQNHRHHHYKNEHYWFTVTSSGTADKLLGTCPDPADVPTSPTAKNLFGARR